VEHGVCLAEAVRVGPDRVVEGPDFGAHLVVVDGDLVEQSHEVGVELMLVGEVATEDIDYEAAGPLFGLPLDCRQPSAAGQRGRLVGQDDVGVEVAPLFIQNELVELRS
jgi:hypothetical protein